MLCCSLGMLSATATLGLVLLWDVDGGLTQIDKYLYSSEDFIKVKKEAWHWILKLIVAMWHYILLVFV